MVEPVSDELKALLRRQELRGATAATVFPREREKAGSTGRASPQVAPGRVNNPSDWMKWANDLIDWEETVDEMHSPSGGEEDRPNGKPASLRIIRARPCFAVIDGGRGAC